MNAGTEIVAQFRNLLDEDGVATDGAVDAFTIDGTTPQCVLLPKTVDELSRCVAAADAGGLTIIAAGNGTQLSIGRRPRQYDIALSTQRLRRILAHEPADMTVTVEAGVTLAALNATLGRAGQWLPLDPPHPERMTIGALIATDASGPLRLSQGKVRDLLIGITVVLADGTVVKGGGRVVKNVAGYDLMKLFTGSCGTLGIIVEATFKLRPLPEQQAVFIVPVTNAREAVTVALSVLSGQLAPQYVEALNHAAAAHVGIAGSAVVVGCGGAREDIEVQRQRLTELLGSVRQCDELAATRCYTALRDFPTTMRRGCACKVSVLPSVLGSVLYSVEQEAAQCGLEVAVLAHVGSGVASVCFDDASSANGALSAFAERLRAIARHAGGWVVLDAVPTHLKDRIDPWGDEIPGIELMRSIKQTLDPRGRLSPGRFVGGI